MRTVERAYDRGTRQGDRWLRTMGEEFRIARLTLGLSQRAVADRVRISRPAYGRIERAQLNTLAVMLAARIAAILGLDLFVALYSGPRALRDEASALMIKQVASEVGPPLRYRTEVGLPQRLDVREQRSWDLVVYDNDARAAFEFESRIYDAQAQTRRHNLKRRDDPTQRFVLAIADTTRNRHVLKLYPELFAELPRLRTSSVLADLRAGRLPRTGLVLLRARATVVPPTPPTA